MNWIKNKRFSVPSADKIHNETGHYHRVSEKKNIAAYPSGNGGVAESILSHELNIENYFWEEHDSPGVSDSDSCESEENDRYDTGVDVESLLGVDYSLSIYERSNFITYDSSPTVLSFDNSEIFPSIAETYRKAFSQETGDLICSYLKRQDAHNYSMAFGSNRCYYSRKRIVIEGNEKANEFISLARFTQPIGNVVVTLVDSHDLIKRILRMVSGSNRIELKLCCFNIDADIIELMLPIRDWSFSMCYPDTVENNRQHNDFLVWKDFSESIRHDSAPRKIEMSPPLPIAIHDEPDLYPQFFFSDQYAKAVTFTTLLARRFAPSDEVDSDCLTNSERNKIFLENMQSFSDSFWNCLAGMAVLLTNRSSKFVLSGYTTRTTLTMDRDRCEIATKGRYDDEARALGGRLTAIMHTMGEARSWSDRVIPNK